MINNKEPFPRRKPTHMKSFDYSENHRYFITICSDGKRKMFSDISVGEGCSPLGRRHEVTVGDSPDRGNVREADKRVAVLA